MPLSFKSGWFTKSTNVSTPVTQSITGVGFQPKAVILYSIRNTTGFADDSMFSIGFSDGTNDRAVTTASTHNASTSSGRRRHADDKLILAITSGSSSSIDWECKLTSLDADGFTLNWTTNNASADLIGYICLGGSDITNVKAGTFDNSNVIGNQDVTDVGFRPSIVFLTNQRLTAANPVSASGSILSLGAATSSSEQFALAFIARHGLTTRSDAFSAQLTDHCYVGLSESNSLRISGLASFVQMLSTGFRINHEVADTGKFFYLAIKGGSWTIGGINSCVSAGIQSTSGLGFAPKGVIFASTGKPASLSALPDANLSFGAGTDSTSEQGVVSTAEQDARLPTVSARAHMFSTTSPRVVRTVNANATADNSTVSVSAFIQSLDTTGFKLNYTSSASLAERIVYIAAGDE